MNHTQVFRTLKHKGSDDRRNLHQMMEETRPDIRFHMSLLLPKIRELFIAHDMEFEWFENYPAPFLWVMEEFEEEVRFFVDAEEYSRVFGGVPVEVYDAFEGGNLELVLDAVKGKSDEDEDADDSEHDEHERCSACEECICDGDSEGVVTDNNGNSETWCRSCIDSCAYKCEVSGQLFEPDNVTYVTTSTGHAIQDEFIANSEHYSYA